jgi:transcription initiation factor TFIIH subunit 1
MANVVKEGGKILLKINLDLDSVSFGFKSIPDRESLIVIIKESISKVVTSSTLSVEDIQARQNLLEKNLELRKIHRDLVMGNIITEDEFWSTRQQSLQEQQWQNQQKKGTSSVLLADIKPADSDGSDLKFTLNADIIHSIFTQYPGVHRAYLDHVPTKLTEKEFWTLYFSSKYFHRNRIVASNKKEQDIFEPYLKEMDADTVLHPTLLYQAKNRLLDLTSTEEDITDKGNGPDRTMKAGSQKESLPLIRKFNRHSKLILEATGYLLLTRVKKQKVFHEPYKQILREIELSDLEPAREILDVPLNIADAASYFDGIGVKSRSLQQSGSVMMEVDLPILVLNSVLYSNVDHFSVVMFQRTCI